MLPDWLFYLAGNSKSHNEISITCTLLQSPYQVCMKKCCQMVERLFVLFYHSRNIPCRSKTKFRIYYYLFEMYCKFISQPKQYLNDPYCQEMCLDMHAKYDCVSSVQKWIGKMMDKKNSLGRSCHLSTT